MPEWTTQGDPRPPDPNALVKILKFCFLGAALFGLLKILSEVFGWGL
jgi:hypothetical protein